jgi:hypothetical protein
MGDEHARVEFLEPSGATVLRPGQRGTLTGVACGLPG